MTAITHSSPAGEFFVVESCLLGGQFSQDPKTGRWDSTQIVFYADYYVSGKSIGFSIFDAQKDTYTLLPSVFYAYEAAEEKLSEIDAEFPGLMDTVSILGKLKAYFTGLPESVYIQAKVTDYGEFCEQCGKDHADRYKFCFFPAVSGTVLDEDSLDICWEFGCHGRSIHGTVAENGEKAMELLMQMHNIAEEQYKPELQRAMDVLQRRMG